MERKRDLRRATVSPVNGLPRRRQRVSTIRNSPEEDTQMESERLRDRDRDFSKRRRVDSYRENESSDSSDEEEPPPPPSSSRLSNNRRSLRTTRSLPIDETIGVPVPRRARSSSTKRLHEYWSTGSAGFTSMKKKKKNMESVEPRPPILNGGSNSRPKSVIQDDIEIEVAEALFDLMKQSQSSKKLDRDTTKSVDDGLKKSEAVGSGDENSAFFVSMKVESQTVMEDLKRNERIEKVKCSDEPARESMSGDVLVNKGKVVSPKESESLSSCVKVNACEIQNQTVTKADYEAVVVESKKEAKFEIDLMAPPPLPSSPERDVLVDVESDAKVATQVVQKEEKIQAISSHLVSNCDLEKHPYDISCVSNGSKQQQRSWRPQKNQSPTSLLSFPIAMNGWPGGLPHPGFLQPLQALLPLDENSRSLTAVQPPQFKFSQPRRKRCATHNYVARSIHHHQKLVNKSLGLGPTNAAAYLYGTKTLNLNSMSPTQKTYGNTLLEGFHGEQNMATAPGGSGNDKNPEVVAATNISLTNKLVPQQASHQAPTNNFLNGAAFIFPFGHHQTTVMAPANTSGPPRSSSALENASLPSNRALAPFANLCSPGGATAVSLNNQNLPSSEASAYIAMLQKNGCPIPISTNFALPPLKGENQGPTMPFFNSSFYSSPVFNFSQNQQQLSLSHALVQPASQNTSTSSGSSSHMPPQSQQKTSKKITNNNSPTLAITHFQQSETKLPPSHTSSKSDVESNRKTGASVSDGLGSQSVKPFTGQTYSFPVQPMNFAMISPGTMSGGNVGNTHRNLQQDPKDRVELTPQAFALSVGPNSSTIPSRNFPPSSAIFHMLPDFTQNGYPGSHTAQQKNFQVSEGMIGKSQSNGGQSLNFSKSNCTDMSASAMGTSLFDGIARTVNFAPSALTGKQAFPSSSAAPTMPNFQQHQHQQQLMQLQKHHMQQMQLIGTTQVKALTSSCPSNNLSFGQVTAQTDNPSYKRQWENLHRTTASEGLSQPPTSTFTNIPQHVKSSQGQTHISFGNSAVSAAMFQGAQIVVNNQHQPDSSSLAGSPSSSSTSKNTIGNLRNASTVGKGGSTASALPSPPADGSSNGPSQKSSPACRKNVPSILSTCPSQLSEVKYS